MSKPVVVLAYRFPVQGWTRDVVVNRPVQPHCSCKHGFEGEREEEEEEEQQGFHKKVFVY
jgi:hypothetical protein